MKYTIMLGFHYANEEDGLLKIRHHRYGIKPLKVYISKRAALSKRDKLKQKYGFDFWVTEVDVAILERK